MAAEAIDIGRWQESLRQLLPRKLGDLLAGSSRRELLKQVGATLLVFDDRLIDLTSGRQSRVLDPRNLDSTSLARAASDLLETGPDDASVILLLPSEEFASTSVDLPGMGREALLSALQLQADTLLPSYSGKLAVAVNPGAGEGLHPDIALWIPEPRLDELYRAFEEVGLFLGAVVPRSLALADHSGDQEILETDSQSMTLVSIHEGVITRWLHVSRKDLEEEIFNRQWRQELASGKPESRMTVDTNSAADAFHGVDTHKPGVIDYYFFPAGALKARRQVEKGKRVGLALAALVVAGLLASLPYLVQSFESRRLLASLEDQRELSRAAREDREVVQNFERQWGVITDFPQQNVVQALFTLQSVLSPDQLTSLELSEGIIRIEGESAEPQGILQRLEQHPMFTEVAFSRATNNSRYYIDLRLSTVNFEGYMVRYFGDN